MNVHLTMKRTCQRLGSSNKVALALAFLVALPTTFGECLIGIPRGMMHGCRRCPCQISILITMAITISKSVAMPLCVRGLYIRCRLDWASALIRTLDPPWAWGTVDSSGNWSLALFSASDGLMKLLQQVHNGAWV